MGRVKFWKPLSKPIGLRGRWFFSTVGIVCSLGLVFVLGVSAIFAGFSYTDLKSNLYFRMESAVQRVSEHTDLSRAEFHRLCSDYVHAFAVVNQEFQLVDENGILLAASSGRNEGRLPGTPEIQDAVQSGEICTYLGEEPMTGERVFAVSAPLVCSNGEIAGVFRLVASMHRIDGKILMVAVIALLLLMIITLVVFASSNYYINSILLPLREITEKAKRITGGAYGIQIKTKYDDEIGDLADAINEMSAQINQNEKMQAEFISSLSHELRTPLTVITGWSETLIDNDAVDTETQRGMRIILREAKRLTEMVVDLLDFTKIQGDRMTLNVEMTDIRGEFEDTVYMYGSRLSQDGMTLIYLDNDEDIPEISCDPKRMRQVFLNILDNAAKHGREGKRIEASIHNDKDAVVVQIRDYGPGIPEDEIPLVKRKFYKGSSKARGTGIGLAVCDEIVGLHGGTLILSNAPEGGTLVTIRIPSVQ